VDVFDNTISLCLPGVESEEIDNGKKMGIPIATWQPHGTAIGLETAEKTARDLFDVIRQTIFLLL
jgi:hypothetical protein